MPKPETIDDLRDLIRRSGLIDDDHLSQFLSTPREGGPAQSTPDGILARLVASRLLTKFQADQLAAGRWRGFIVGSYRLLDKLGSGGMGTVYLAELVEVAQGTGRPLAVKVIDARLADNPIARERFAREAWATASLTHPNIVRVEAVHVDDNPPHLVMEYVDGVTLQAAVARGGTLSTGNTAYCGQQASLGLDLACDAGLVHRDIKPANLLVDRTGTLKILDLGIVRIPGAGDLTQRYDSKTILGTADYLAPEQARDSSSVDSRADIYALGATLYFLLAGHPPFPEGTPDKKLAKKQSDDPPRIDELRPDVPKELADVVHRMLARRPEDRYPRPSAVAVALAPWAQPDSHFPGALLATLERNTVVAASGATPIDARKLPSPVGQVTAELHAKAAPTTQFASQPPSLPAPLPTISATGPLTTAVVPILPDREEVDFLETPNALPVMPRARSIPIAMIAATLLGIAGLAVVANWAIRDDAVPKSPPTKRP